jgi:heterotetrameric sarcosine oxidase gamma subunit
VSADQSTPASQAFRIDGAAAERLLEFKAFAYPLVGGPGVDLAAAPGEVRRDASGRATLLYFAPGRFLAPAPAPEVVQQLDALAAAGVGAVFDVDGKWRTLTVTGPGAARLLSAGADVAALLAHRDCAALHLFDCPALLARRHDGFELWVEASYATDLRASLDRIGAQR